MPAVPGFVNENGAMGERTTAAGAESEFGCAGHDDQCGAGCVETAMTPLGAGPTPGPEVGSPISNCAISPGQTVLQKGISTAGRGHRPLDFHCNSLLFVVLLRKR